MNKKYLVPILVGLGAVILFLVAGALLFSGQEEGAAGTGAAALMAAEVARRQRERVRAELARVAEAAESSNERVEELRNNVAKTMKESGESVDATSLTDLIAEENERT